MGTLFPDSDSHLESIVFFLSESLVAALQAGDHLQHSICRSPHIEPDMNCSELAGQLAGFRKTMQDLWECELLLVTKILRASDLAKELRNHEPELKPEIDTFRLTAIMANDLRDRLLPNANSVFNGQSEPKRFLESRGHVLEGGAMCDEPLRGYKVAGETDVRLLLDACEALHYSLAARYGAQVPALSDQRTELLNAQRLAAAFEDDELLELNLDEIVSDPLASQLTEWSNRQLFQRLSN
ncbi:MAG TPA: hypothetical protein VKA94_12215 [Hyphomicrobiales bacterium]|nr:hypothetical protein [Hyphomicrobiales bacterium]